MVEKQQPLPSTNFPSKFLPIILITAAPRLKAPSKLNFTKFTGGGIHCSEELSTELRDSTWDTSNKEEYSDWAEQLVFKTEIGHIDTLSKAKLYLANQMDRPTKIKLERRCIRSLLVFNFEIRVNKYCRTVYVEEGGWSVLHMVRMDN